MKYVIGFEDERADNPAIVGQKFRSLAIASRAGFAVPRAFAISTRAHRHYLSTNRWPEELKTEVNLAAQGLKLNEGISIRSSAIREDLEGQSFAGQYQTFLKVFTPDDLYRKIETCWNSAQTEVVRSYLQALENNQDDTSVPLMGVVLQKMVNASAAGIAFGRNPMNPTRDEIVIEAVKGLADTLVSGQTSPHRAIINDGRISRIEQPDDNGAGPVDGGGKLLRDEQWQAVAKLVRSLETKTGVKPLDVEWAIDRNDQLWVLQSRVITTLTAVKPDVPPGTWTRKIADDLWADRLTPLLSEAMLANAHRFDLSRIAGIVGLPVTRPTLTVIDGYLYVNCAGIEKVTAYVPKRLRTADLKDLFPANVDVDKIETVSVFKLLTLMLRSALLPMFEPGAIPVVCLLNAGRMRSAIERHLIRLEQMPDQTPRMALERLRYALKMMGMAQKQNQWPYFYATLFTWVFRWLIVDRARLSHATFLGLLGRGGRNISIEIERAFRDFVKDICSDTELAQQILSWSAADALDGLPQGFRHKLNRFLQRYGCRSRHRTLFVKRWAEAPEEVIGILQSLIRHKNMRALDTGIGKPNTGPRKIRVGDPDSTATMKDRPAGFFDRVNTRFWLTLADGFILKLTSKFLDLREDLRFLLDKALYRIRLAALELGSHLGLGEMALFLTLAELEQAVDGRISANKARNLASERLEQFLKPTTVHTFYVEGQPQDAFDRDGDLIRGLGTSPGRSTGRARIVDNPANTDIQRGDIVVARNTDPGWTPILSSVGGVVVEEGGLLNHCSIVARELGVPSIVGVGQATRIIPDGALITIDGGLGIVLIEK